MSARSRSRLLWVAAFLATWLFLLRLPSEPIGANLEQSWRAALAYLSSHRFQYGTQVMFTYGPLGYLMQYFYGGWLFGRKIAWELAFNAAAAGVLLAAARRLKSLPARAAFLLTIWGGLSASPDALYIAVLLACGCLLPGAGLPAAVFLGALLGVLSLVKFSFVPLALVCATAASGLELRRGNRSRAGLAPVSFAAGLGAAWAAQGQALANLPAYLRSSLEIAAGFPGAMQETAAASSGALGLGLGACFLFAPALALALDVSGDALEGGVKALPCAAAFFLVWKEGFMRADAAHGQAFFAFAAAAPFLAAAFLTFPRHRFAARALLAGTCAFSWAGLAAVARSAGETGPAAWAYWEGAVLRAGGAASQILSPRDLRANLEPLLQRQRAFWDLPRTRAAVAGAAVDMFGQSQGVVLLNRLNYRPRPVFQSFSAYTPFLLEKNALYYEGAGAPPYVVFELRALDGRFPAMSDGPALLALLHHYAPILEEKTFLLMKRTSAPPLRPPREPLASGIFRFGEDIPAPAGSEPVEVSLHLRPSWLGRLRDLLYRPAEVRLLARVDGVPRDFRLVPGIAEDGFLLNPFVETEGDVVGLYAGAAPRKLSAFSVVPADGTEWCWEPSFDVEFRQLPGLVRAVLSPEQARRLEYPMLPAAPVSARWTAAPRILLMDGEEGLLAFAPAALRLRVPADARSLSGRFGLMPFAYAGEQGTSGVVFSVRRGDARGGDSSLFRRFLDPRERPSDRGLQEFRVALPPGAAGEVVLETEPAPGSPNLNAWDWSVWTDVGFEGSQDRRRALTKVDAQR